MLQDTSVNTDKQPRIKPNGDCLIYTATAFGKEYIRRILKKSKFRYKQSLGLLMLV